MADLGLSPYIHTLPPPQKKEKKIMNRTKYISALTVGWFYGNRSLGNVVLLRRISPGAFKKEFLELYISPLLSLSSLLRSSPLQINLQFFTPQTAAQITLELQIVCSTAR